MSLVIWPESAVVVVAQGLMGELSVLGFSGNGVFRSVLVGWKFGEVGF